MNARRILNPDAVLKRCARVMRADKESPRACDRRSKHHAERGDVYIANDAGVIVSTHIDLQHLARQLGVLRDSDLSVEPDARSLEQLEALVYEARERLYEAQGCAHERKLRADLADAEDALRRARAVGRTVA